MLRKYQFGAKIRGIVWGQNLICMDVYCRIMFELNYSIGDIRNSDLGEGIVCLGEGSGDEGSLEKGGGKWGKRGREVGIRGGEGSGKCLPPCPPPLFT